LHKSLPPTRHLKEIFGMSDNPGDFSGKTVLVTGASSGIGRAAAIQLARQGAMVIVAARRELQGLRTVESITAEGGAAEFIAVDIADQASIDALFAAIEARHDRLDAAFNNAGTEGEAAPLPDVPLEEFDRVINVNVRGTWLCMRHETRIMRAQGYGAIVNTASIAGVVGFPMSSAYTASKHAVVGMTKSASLDFAASGIRINCLCPGGTSTEMSARWVSRVPGGEAVAAQGVPMKRFGKADELARAAVFLLSDAASYMTGSIMTVDGGSTTS
jgi:NAD(P)-dependent dehydrogenase (short-subunit alcohol dehydrogenase family)